MYRVLGESAWVPLLVCGYAALLYMQNPALCVLTSKPAFTFSAIWFTVAFFWVVLHRPVFTPHVHLWALATHKPLGILLVFLPCIILASPEDCRTWTSHNSCGFGIALTQSSNHHNLAPACPPIFFTFQNINVKDNSCFVFSFLYRLLCTSFSTCFTEKSLDAEKDWCLRAN